MGWGHILDSLKNGWAWPLAFHKSGGSDGVLGEHELHQGCLLTFYLKKNCTVCFL